MIHSTPNPTEKQTDGLGTVTRHELVYSESMAELSDHIESDLAILEERYQSFSTRNAVKLFFSNGSRR